MTKHSPSSGKKAPDSTCLYHKTGFSLLLITLLLAGFVTSAQAQPVTGATPRIVGGTAAKASEYPWVAALLRTANSGVASPFCGGTLIASRWVLTAAHCVDELSSPGDIEVAIGISNVNNIRSADRIAIDTIFVHSRYNTVSQNNDIALLRLVKPSNNAVLAIADNTLTNNIAVGELMTVIGWGTTSANPLTPLSFPDLLQETQIPLTGFDACNTIYNNSLTNNMICAGFAAGGQDTCQGDSGGPMLYFNTSDSTYYQTGVTSFGNGCAQANNPGVYTRAANYLDWIDSTTLTPLSGQRQFSYHGINRSTSTILTLHNYSGASITVSAVNLGNPENFTLLSQNCTGTTIANNGNCTMTLQFQAARAGTHLATLSVDFGTDNPSLNTTISGIGLATTNAAGLDEPSARLWYSGGSAIWLNAFTSNSNGGTAMRSGNISDNQNTALLAYFTGPSTLGFRWRASTEPTYDLLKLYVDDTLVATISGDQDWQQRNIPLSTGEHRVVWVYEKDNSVSSFQDTVWLDSINTFFTVPPIDNTTSSGFGNGGGGKPDELFLLLLAVILILRKGLHRAASPNNKQHMADA